MQDAQLVTTHELKPAHPHNIDIYIVYDQDIRTCTQKARRNIDRPMPNAIAFQHCVGFWVKWPGSLGLN